MRTKIFLDNLNGDNWYDNLEDFVWTIIKKEIITIGRAAEILGVETSELYDKLKYRAKKERQSI